MNRSGEQEERAGRGRIAPRLVDALLAEQERWFLWVPVALIAGIALYFALPREPFLVAPATLAVLLAAAAWRLRDRPVAFAATLFVALVAAGMALAKLRADLVAAPVLERTLVAARATGWIEEAEPRHDGRLRLQIRVSDIERLPQSATPRRVLVSLRGVADAALYPPGAAVRLTAYLQPPPEPVAPGAYDFARASFFQGIGAVGTAHAAPSAWAGAPAAPVLLRAAATVDRMRSAIAERIRGSLAGEPGVIAAALITGLRGDISEGALEALRAAGLAHILAISGLHMALMAGSLFWLVRAVLAAFPGIAVHYPVKRIAAGAALAGATFYLFLSGASVATQRAYIMMAIMLVAVMLRRSAITMRNVALAAIAVIVVAPESVLSASFQMSFAAATALVAAYELRRARLRPFAGGDAPAGLLRSTVRYLAVYFLAILVTTLVASAATAPFAAYHFHRIAPFGLLGNLLAMPAVGLLVMPAGLAAVLAMPFGLDPVALFLMGLAIEWVLASAQFVAGLPGAEDHVRDIPALGLALIVAGFLWLVLWRRRWRLAGLGAAAGGIVVALLAQGPDVLIDRSGANVAVRSGADGSLSLLTRQPDGFTAGRWLESDGDGRPAEEIDGSAFSCDPHACIAALPQGGTLAIVRHRAALEEECASARIVVVRFRLTGPCAGPELVLDEADLERHGTHAVWIGAAGITLRKARPVPGARPWAGRPMQEHLAAPDEGRPARPASKKEAPEL